MDHRSTEGLSTAADCGAKKLPGGLREDSGRQLALGVLRVHNSADGVLPGKNTPTLDVEYARYGIPDAQ